MKFVERLVMVQVLLGSTSPHRERAAPAAPATADNATRLNQLERTHSFVLSFAGF